MEIMINNDKGIDIDKYKKTNKVYNEHLFMLVREIILNSFPYITENFKFGIPTYEYNNTRICSIDCFETHLKVKFFNEPVLDDPSHLLHEQEKNLQHMNIYSKDDLDPYMIYHFIKKTVNKKV